MARRKKLRNTRPKAFLGIGETGAIIAQTAAQVASMAAQTAATYKSAKDQADAQLASAKQQAEALEAQNQNANKLQTDLMEFTQAENEQNRQLMRDMQMNLQMQAGALSSKERRQASRTMVKKGGRKRRKLRNPYSSLQGGNIGFKVIDGGGVMPIGKTPEGYDMYEIYGNDHNHYHKAQGGKHKTGVGIKFEDGQVIEGEGNQRSNQGELMITTPDDALFLSKHSIGGMFNPTESVKEGMDPIQAYAIQEYIKSIYAIEDGNTTPIEKRKLKLAGGNTAYLPLRDFGNLMFIPGATSLAYEEETLNNARNSAKYGTSTRKRIKSKNNRHKAWGGYGTRFFNYLRTPDDLNGNNPYGTEWDGGTKGEVVVTAPTPSKGSNWWNNLTNKLGNTVNNPKNWWVAPTISMAGNLLGAGVSALGTGLAGRTLSNAIRQRSDILANAYGNLKGVNAKDVFGKDMFNAMSSGFYMPAVRSSEVNVNPQLNQIQRDKRQSLKNISYNTGSSAAALNRAATADMIANDKASQVYADKMNRQEQIKQANNQAINEAGQANAQLMMQYLKDYTSQKADLAKFNANIENEKIIGAAEAQASGINDIGQIGSQSRMGIANAFGSALSQSGLGYANALNARNDYMRDIDLAMINATPYNMASYYTKFGSDSEAIDFINSLISQSKDVIDSDARSSIFNNINRIINSRFSKKGWGTINSNNYNTFKLS